MKKTLAQKIIFYLAAAVIVIIYFYPIYILMISSLKPLKQIYINTTSFPTKDVITWNNFVTSFQGLEYWRTFSNSVMISFGTAALSVLFNSMTAWALTRYKRKLSNVFYYGFALSMLIPFQCVMLPLVKYSSMLGMLNRAGLIFVYIGLHSSLSIVLISGFIKGIPVEIEEAAYIDGGSTYQIFFLVIFPLLKTILITVAILSIINTWNDYLLPSLMINKSGWQTLPLKTYLYVSQFVKRWDLATAGLILCIIPIMIFYLFCQKYIIRGVTEGALKG